MTYPRLCDEWRQEWMNDRQQYENDQFRRPYVKIMVLLLFFRNKKGALLFFFLMNKSRNTQLL